MNMFARFDENPAMTLRVIKETKRYGRTDGRMDARTDNVKTVYPLQTKFAGGIITIIGKSIGVSSPGNLTSMKQQSDFVFSRRFYFLETLFHKK